MRRSFLAILALTFCTAISAQTRSDSTSEVFAPYYYRQMDYKGHTKQSYYVMMDDSIRLAVNVYLPKGLKKGEKIPAVLFETRYWRAAGVKWPFNLFVDVVPHTRNFPVLELPRYGYGLITVDVRGTGASEGEKLLTLSDMREILDSKNMIDWAVKQSWCNGNVGATGVSFIGNTALYALYNEHPNLKAIVPAYSVWDLYDDVSAPGGIYFHQFISQYGVFCNMLDHNIIPESRNARGTRLSYGVERVKGTTNKEMKRIFADHDCNNYQQSEGSTAEFTDDEFTINGQLRVKDVLSPHQFADRIRASGAAIYSWSGWWDASFCQSAVRQFINLDDGRNRLRLGPWNHGGGANVSPNYAAPSQFDDVKEVVRFFDFYLKGIDNGLDSSPRVYYYTMIENRWKGADSWPPPSIRTKLYLAGNGSTDWNMPQAQDVASSYDVDTTHTLDDDCRWNFDTNQTGITYADASAEDSITLVYRSPELSDDMEVTGHVLMNLYLKSSTPDGSVFAYLEDVDEHGNVWKVTDGQMRFIHRKVLDEPVFYKDVVPTHSYRHVDAAPMDTSAVELVSFDMLPTSYLFKKGHSLQIRLAGVDTYNFKNLYPEGGHWEVHSDSRYPSNIDLPVIDNGKIIGLH